MTRLSVILGLLLATIYSLAQGSSDSRAAKSEASASLVALNQAARPLFEAVITKRLHIGDKLDEARRVLAYAGLEAVAGEKGFAGRSLDALYRTGPRSGIAVHLEFDHRGEIVTIQTNDVLDVGA